MKHGKTIVDTTLERDFGNELSTNLLYKYLAFYFNFLMRMPRETMYRR